MRPHNLPEELDRLPDEWPRYDCNGYINLLCAATQIKAEADLEKGEDPATSRTLLSSLLRATLTTSTIMPGRSTGSERMTNVAPTATVAASPLAMNPRPRSRLLELPAELRCLIYDFTFSEMLAQRQVDQHRFLLPNEYPSNNFREFNTLALTCKLISTEAREGFTKDYFDGVRLYFDDVRALYCYTKRTGHLAAKYQQLPFTLTMHSTLLTSARHRATHHEFRHSQFLRNSPCFNLMCKNGSLVDHESPGHYTCRRCQSTYSVVQQGQAMVVISKCRMNNESFQLQSVRIRGMGRSLYREFSGRLCDLNWEAYLATYGGAQYIAQTTEEVKPSEAKAQKVKTGLEAISNLLKPVEAK